MSQQEFESYLRLLARFLHLNGGQREAIARELRAHLEDRLEELLARGYAREDAIETALDEFGDAAALAGEFGRIGRRRRWIMRTTTATIGIAATILLVSFLLPEHRPWLPAPSYSQADGGQGSAAPNAPPAAEHTTRRSEQMLRPGGEAENDARTLEVLQQKLAVVDLPEGTGFADAVEFLRAQTKLNIHVNWAALALIGVERTTDVLGVTLRDVRVETILELLLANMTHAGGNAGRVTYDLADGVIRISSEDDLGSRLQIWVYDCRDLTQQPLTPVQLQALDVFAARLTSNASAGARPGKAAQTQPGQGASAEPTSQRDRHGSGVDPLIIELMDQLRDRNADQLRTAIVNTIAPDTWQPKGTAGQIEFWHDRLIIRQTWAVQRQITDLLRTLRATTATPDSGPTSTAIPD